MDIIDYFNPYLAPIALIHDMEWMESDGSWKSFSRSNRRLKKNGKTLADVTYKWYRPGRYIMRSNAVMMYAACQAFGYPIWVSHHLNSKRSDRMLLVRACLFNLKR